MLFYSFESLDDFIENNLILSIQKELNRLHQLSKLYKEKKLNLDMYSNDDEYITNSSKKLENICNLIDFLQNSLTNIISLYDKDIDGNYNEIKADLIEYNKKIDQLYDEIFSFENTAINALYSKSKKNKKSKDEDFHEIYNLKNNIEINPTDNNLLLISEKEQKAYLPYKYSEVKDIFLTSNNKYKTLQDVVNALYIIPLSKFKNSSFARFREAFYLIRNKEHLSITKALDLGLELMFKYELNPIVIAACRNLDELDIYLDCLEENELYEFNCFEIKFEISPKPGK